MKARNCKTVEAYYFKPDGAIPNHPHLPVLIYGGVLPDKSADAAGKFERLLNENYCSPLAQVISRSKAHRTSSWSVPIPRGRKITI